MSEKKVREEEFSVSGDALLDKIKQLLKEGNIRRIIIKNEKGRTLIDIPLSVGVVGALIKPKLAAVGALAAMFSHGTILIEREVEAEAEE